MKTKNIFLSLILSFFITTSSLSMKPIGLVNEGGICYANAAIQMLFAIPGIQDYLTEKYTSVAQDLLNLYNSYKAGAPDSALKIKIIKQVMETEQINNNDTFVFLEKLFSKIDPEAYYSSDTPLDSIQNILFSKLNTIIGVTKNHIISIIHTGGHFYAQVKHNGKWYEINDNNVKQITEPLNADLNSRIKPIISLSLLESNPNLNQIDYKENSSYQNLRNRASNIIEMEKITSSDNINRLQGLITETEYSELLLNQENFIILDGKLTNIFNEVGLKRLTVIIAMNMANM